MQNIDSLEAQAGLPKDLVVAAHGNFDSAHCIKCRKEHTLEHVRKAVDKGKGEPARCTRCGARSTLSVLCVLHASSQLSACPSAVHQLLWAAPSLSRVLHLWLGVLQLPPVTSKSVSFTEHG